MRYYVKQYGILWAVCKKGVRLLPFHREEYYDIILDKFDSLVLAEKHAEQLNEQNFIL